MNMIVRSVLCMVLLALAPAASARAEPITGPMPFQASVTFPFSVQITLAFGPMERLFGRSFEVGDHLSGRVIFDGTSGPAMSSSPNDGQYAIPSGRIELDVPSEFTVQANRAERFNAEVFDNIAGLGDELIFNGFECCHPSGVGFVNVDVLWLDFAGNALVNPTTVAAELLKWKDRSAP